MVSARHAPLPGSEWRLRRRGGERRASHLLDVSRGYLQAGRRDEHL
ncbi:MAG: hypothetical protein ACRDSL_09720 [Pseudonocardiaceae bacterium]